MENGEVVHDNNNDIDGKRDINNNEKKDFGNPINKFFGENFFKDKKESTTSDSSDDMENKEKELKKSKWKDKKKELLQEIVKLKNELENEQSLVKDLNAKLQEERDARERVETNLSELQTKYEKKLTEEEQLRCIINDKDEKCQTYEKEIYNLKQSLVYMTSTENKDKDEETEEKENIEEEKENASDHSDDENEKEDEEKHDDEKNEDEDTDDENEYTSTNQKDIPSLEKLQKENNSLFIEEAMALILNEPDLDSQFHEIIKGTSPYILRDEFQGFVNSYVSKQELLKTFSLEIERLKSLNEELKDTYEKDKTQFKEEQEIQIKDIIEEKVQARMNIFHEEEEEKIKDRLEKNMRKRIQEAEKELLDQKQLQSRIRTLEREKSSVQDSLDEETKKYSEALITLKEVQEAYGEMRDVILERYKSEIVELTNRVRIAEESNNESLITALRQQVLDSRLTLERSRQNHEDDINLYKKKEVDHEKLKKELYDQIDELKNEIYKLKIASDNLQITLNKAEEVTNEKTQNIADLKSDIKALEDSLQLHKKVIVEKEEQIADLREQIAMGNETIEKINEEKEILKKEMEVIATLRQNIVNMSEEAEGLKQDYKLKKAKAKYLKRQLKETDEQKQKFESIVNVIPEMQKQIDVLQNEKTNLEETIKNMDLKSKQEKERQEVERRMEEEKRKKIKEDWERSILGIGDCANHSPTHYDGESDFSVIEHSVRPGSAPPMKPHPPSGRTSTKKSYTHRSITPMSNTFPSTFIDSRYINEKVRYQNGNAYLIKRNNFVRSASLKSSQSSKSEDLPKLHKRRSLGSPPRVLLWNHTTTDNRGVDGSGNKLLAIGDRVACKILTNCECHGKSTSEHTGIVKFIGFISGNQTDVYIGVRLDDDVGNTDGMVEGRRYFRCEPNRGKFVRYEDITRVLETKALHVPLT